MISYRLILSVLKAMAIFAWSLYLLNWSFSQNVVEKHFDSMVFLNISTASQESDAIKQKTATGFIVCDDGYILTNAHIIPTHEKGEYRNLSITGSVGSRGDYPYNINDPVRVDEYSDLMLLKFAGYPPSDIKAVKLAIPSEIDVGDDLYSLGYPFDEDLTVKFGKLNSKVSQQGWITDLGFDDGDSGGPVFNSDDHVVGVAKVSKSVQGDLRFVIPINKAKSIIGNECDPHDPDGQTKNVTITLEYVVIHDACDGGFNGPEGEVFGAFRINDELVYQLPKKRFKDGDILSLNVSRTIEFKRDTTREISIEGFLKEDDEGNYNPVDGNDSIGIWKLNLDPFNSYGAQQRAYSHPDCDATLYYSIK